MIRNNPRIFRSVFPSDVYQKLTELDQRATEHCIRLNRVNTHLEKCVYELNYTKVAARETCNGLFVWEITNLEKLKAQMMSNQNFNIYSSPFSSSERGYRLVFYGIFASNQSH